MGAAKQGRRQYGTGAVFQRHDHPTCPPVNAAGERPAHACKGLWIGRAEAGWSATGTRRRVNASAKTEAECKRRLRAKQLRIAEGDSAAVSARATIKAWSEEWLPQHARKVRHTTYATDAGAIRKWIIPTIGHRRLSDITPADLRTLRSAITGAGRSTTTALHAHKTLLTMLKAAIVEGHPVPQRVLLAPKPAKATNDRTRLALEQALAVMSVAKERPDAGRWVAALLQGMRSGECRGLTWEHVDLDAEAIDVSWQVQRLPYKIKRDPSSGFRIPDGFEARQLDGPLHWTRPKTRSGRRTIPLVPLVTLILRREREAWQPNPHDLVWAEPDGSPLDVQRDRDAWHALQNEAGVAHPSGRPYHLHEARHTAASMLRELGYHDQTIESILGQSSLVTSYVHIGLDRQRAAMADMATALGLVTPKEIAGPAPDAA